MGKGNHSPRPTRQSQRFFCAMGRSPTARSRPAAPVRPAHHLARIAQSEGPRTKTATRFTTGRATREVYGYTRKREGKGRGGVGETPFGDALPGFGKCNLYAIAASSAGQTSACLSPQDMAEALQGRCASHERALALVPVHAMRALPLRSSRLSPSFAAFPVKGLCIDCVRTQ